VEPATVPQVGCMWVQRSDVAGMIAIKRFVFLSKTFT